MEPLKIVVVDDAPIIVRSLTMLLEQFEFKVVGTASNGREAVAAYQTLRPDVVTMDITMPEMDGITATREIMAQFPTAKIIMVTSHGQEKMVLDALKAGAKGYVLKPFQPRKVAEALEKSLKISIITEKLMETIAQRSAEKPAPIEAVKVTDGTKVSPKA
jgi:two-component system chemotaxis response regulator CheY